MSLIPEIERELLNVAREGAGPEDGRGEKIKRLSLRTPLTMLVLLAVAGMAVGVALLVTPGKRHNPATSGALPRARLGLPPRWRTGGRGCPIERRRPLLPKRSGCVTIGSFDVNGDRRLDRILLYGNLSTRHAGQTFIPTSFTLTVLITGGRSFTTQINHPRANVTLDSAGNFNSRPGVELFLNENRFRARGYLARQPQLLLIYAFNGDELVRAGSFRWWGSPTRKYGITCHKHPAPLIIQHEFLRQGRLWRRIDTTYRWFGATLRPTTRTTSEQPGPPSQTLTTVDCTFA